MLVVGRERCPTARPPPREQGAQAEVILVTFIFFYPCTLVAAASPHRRKQDLTQAKMNPYKPNKTYSLRGFAYLDSSSS